MNKLIDILFNHERYQTIATIICAILLICFYGCEVKCKSILNPTEKVTRAELDVEIEALIAKANAGYASLEQQEKLRDILFQQAMSSASTGIFNPIALITSCAGLLGVGATVDNVRKRKEIKRLTTET